LVPKIFNDFTFKLTSSLTSLIKAFSKSSQNSRVHQGSKKFQAQYFCEEFFFKSNILPSESVIIALV